VSHKKRKYTVKVNMSKTPPVELFDENNNLVGSRNPIIFNKTTDRMRKVDPYRIRFIIEDFGNSPLRFTPNEDDVFWANKGTTCPTTRCGLPGVMWVDKVDRNGEWIDVINMDLTELEFQFTLNFVEKSNPQSSTYIALDPPGGNQNAGGPGSGFTLSGLVTVGVATGAIVGLGTAAFASKYFVEQSLLVYGLGGALIGLLVGLLARRI